MTTWGIERFAILFFFGSFTFANPIACGLHDAWTRSKLPGWDHASNIKVQLIPNFSVNSFDVGVRVEKELRQQIVAFIFHLSLNNRDLFGVRCFRKTLCVFGWALRSMWHRSSIQRHSTNGVGLRRQTRRFGVQCSEDSNHSLEQPLSAKKTQLHMSTGLQDYPTISLILWRVVTSCSRTTLDRLNQPFVFRCFCWKFQGEYTVRPMDPTWMSKEVSITH